MKVNEIFTSIDGEGTRAGYPVQFIRFSGCNMRCSYCDTTYALVYGDGTEMSINEIMAHLQGGPKKVTITGGEPLLQRDICELLYRLSNEQYEVNVETNGSIFPPTGPEESHIFYTVDYKCNSSGMNHLMHEPIWDRLCWRDVVKFVVGSQEDMEQALKFLKSHHYLMLRDVNIFFSPVFGSIEPADIVKFLLDSKMWDCRVQIQMHKVIWDPNMRGV